MHLASIVTLTAQTSFVQQVFAEEEAPVEKSTSLAVNLTEEEKTILEYNQRIAVFNRAPADYPSFIRNGFQVRVLTKDGYVEQEDGLIFKDYKVGPGLPVEDGQQITFNYTAYNESGAVIDTTYTKDRPATIRLGIGGMIPGFEEGIKTMRIGGNRRIVVPPELGPPVGPSTFFSARQFEVFDVELLTVSSCDRKDYALGLISKVVCETLLDSAV